MISTHVVARRRQRLAGLVAGLVLVASACSDGDDPVATDEATTASVEQSTDDGGSPQPEDPTSSSSIPALPAPGASAGSTTAGAGDGAGDGDGDGESDTGPVGPGGPWQQVDYRLIPVASMSQPTALTARPGSGDLWVAERVGRVRRIERALDVGAGTERLSLSPSVVLDVTDAVGTEGEGGLLGLAFAPDGGRLYVHYTDRGGDTVVSSFPMAETTADRGQERVLLTVEQPFSNHNGGDLAFGPDGMLYIAIGDGGSANDPLGHGQNADTLLGAVLRIEPTPDGPDPYRVPDDNPFVAGGGAAEIWMWGLRNPWRFSFDPATGDLWVGDVGQNQVEEINRLAAASGPAGRGANLGWNLREGDQSFAGDEPAGHVGPIHTYGRDGGRCSVTGGYVYRGSFAPSLDGVYLFADYCTSAITGLQAGADGAVTVADLRLDRSVSNVISFGRGPGGEVYVLEQGGRISRVQPAGLALETDLASG